MNDDIKFKAVTFVENGDILHGHYFYDVTLPEALDKMKSLGIDPKVNFKMTIAVYYY
jgi:hypothetical protein